MFRPPAAAAAAAAPGGIPTLTAAHWIQVHLRLRVGPGLRPEPGQPRGPGGGPGHRDLSPIARRSIPGPNPGPTPGSGAPAAAAQAPLRTPAAAAGPTSGAVAADAAA